MYLFIGICLGIFALLEISCKYDSIAHKKFLQLYLYVAVALFFVYVVGFREVGFDYDNYLQYFKTLNSPYWSDNAEVLMVEKGYAYLNYFLGSYWFLLLNIAIVTIVLQFSFIYKYSPLPFFSLFLYLGIFLYPSLMGQYRQALAIGFSIWAFVLIDKKWLFFSCIGCALLFHLSALLVLGVLFLSKKFYTKKFYWGILFLALLLNIFLKPIFANYLSIFPSVISDKLSIYAKGEAEFVLGLNMAMLLRIVTFTLFYWKREHIAKYRYGIYFLNIYYLSLLIYLGLGFLPQVGGRGSIYFYFVEIILAAMLIAQEVKMRRFAFLFFFIAVSVYRQVSFFSVWSEDYMPYRNCLGRLLGL